MKSFSDQRQDPNSRALANQLAFPSAKARASRFVDGRPVAMEQSKLQRMADSSPMLATGAHWQSLANSYTQAHPFSDVRIPPVQRAEVEPSKREDKPFKEISKLTLANLVAYTQAQADWKTGLNETEFQFVFAILHFVQESKSLGPYGRFTIEEFYSWQGKLYQSLPDLLHKLALAQKETQDDQTDFKQPIRQPAMFDSLVVFFQGIEALGTFYNHVPKSVQKTMLGDVFALMNLDHKLDFFYKYLALRPTPIFESEKDSYNFMKYGDLYLQYATDSNLKKLNFIQNFHRFEPTVLKTLEANSLETNNKKRPLTLIIYTSHDPSGSFVSKDSLPPVISNPNNLTILIEGQGSLSNFGDAAEYIAKTYGLGGQISQVLICGHGSTQEIDLVGDPGGKERLSAVPGKEKPTLAFFTRLINLMYHHKPPSGLKVISAFFSKKPPPPNEIEQLSRIVFSACEVNAVVMPEKPSDLDDGLENFFDKNKSLVQTLIELTGEGDEAYPKVKGANASVRSKGQELIDSEGKLDLVSKEDPALTAPKLEYLEKGTMVDGVVGAAAMLLAKNKKAAILAMQTRLKRKPQKLEDVFIHALFSFLAERDFSVISLLNAKVNFILLYHRFRKLPDELRFPFSLSDINIGFSDPEKPTFLDRILPLFKAINYYDQAIFELTLAQLYCRLKKDWKWVVQVMSKMSCQEAAPYLSWEILNPFLKPILSGATAPILKLAISGLVKGNKECQEFLQSFVVSQPKEQFNPQIEPLLSQCIHGFTAVNSLPALLNKVTGKEEALDFAFEAAETEKFTANLSPVGSAQNTVYVRPNLQSGSFVKPEVQLHRLPEAAVVSKAELKPQEIKPYKPKQSGPVMVLGETQEFWAISHPDEPQTVFVKKADIKLEKYQVSNLDIGKLRTT